MSQRFTHGLLLVIAGLLAANLLQAPTAGVAHAQSMNGGKPSVFAVAMPGQGSGQNVLYLIDPAAKRMSVYDDTARGQLVLRCVRTFDYEQQLEVWPKEPKKLKAAKRVQVPSVQYMYRLANPN